MTNKTLSIITLCVILIVIYFLPNNKLWLGDYSITCIHQKILGFGCPGCGMTRAIHSVLHFNFKEAANLNFAVFGLFPFLFFQSISGLTKNLNIKMLKRVTAILFFSLLFVQYILRMPL